MSYSGVTFPIIGQEGGEQERRPVPLREKWYTTLIGRTLFDYVILAINKITSKGIVLT